MKIRLHSLRQAARTKPPGYLEDVLAHGKLVGDVLTLSTRDYHFLCAKYRQFGDAVATVAQPIARAMDKVFHTHVSGCSACEKRQRLLNGGADPVKEIP